MTPDTEGGSSMPAGGPGWLLWLDLLLLAVVVVLVLRDLKDRRGGVRALPEGETAREVTPQPTIAEGAGIDGGGTIALDTPTVELARADL